MKFQSNRSGGRISSGFYTNLSAHCPVMFVLDLETNIFGLDLASSGLALGLGFDVAGTVNT
jgi:hypothetical protein